MCIYLLFFILSIALSILLPFAQTVNNFDENFSLIGASPYRLEHIDIGTGAVASMNVSAIESSLMAVEYDRRHNCVYYAESSRTIGRICLNESNPIAQPIVSVEETKSGCIAYDWSADLLYFIDGQSIYAIEPRQTTTESARRQIIIQSENSNPIALAISPMDGYLFHMQYITGQVHSFTIWRAHLDGSHSEFVITLPGNPYLGGRAFTIDLKRKQLYWIQYDDRRIISCDFDGTAHKTISLDFTRQPLALMFHDDWMFWYDSQTHGVYAAKTS